MMCGEIFFVGCSEIEDLIQEYLFEKKMRPIIQKRLEDGQMPIPVNLEDLL